MIKPTLLSRLSMCIFYNLKTLKIKVIKKLFEVLKMQKHTLPILYIYERKNFPISDKIDHL